MAGVPVLGPVVLQGFEIPERISLGGKQQLAVHRLPGGGRVIDAMGPDEGPLKWSGVFTGPLAAERVRVLERLRRAGEPLPLAWEGWRFTVVIQSFEFETASPWWISYRIQLVVLQDGDEGVDDLASLAVTLAEAVALGAGDGLDERIAAAEAGIGAADVAVAVASAGVLARLVTARAFVGALG